jgi:Fe-S-cluster containining protein
MQAREDEPVRDSAPCIGCGLCCNGVLHDHVILEEHEARRMRSLGHGTGLVPEKHSLKLSCTYFACGTCNNYEERFETCRSYRCSLLRRYHAGEISLEQCRAKVEEAQALITKIEETDPGSALHSTRGVRAKSLQDSLKTASSQERLGIAGRMLNLMALERLLETEFRYRKPNEEASSADSP